MIVEWLSKASPVLLTVSVGHKNTNWNFHKIFQEKNWLGSLLKRTRSPNIPTTYILLFFPKTIPLNQINQFKSMPFLIKIYWRFVSINFPATYEQKDKI